MATRQKSPPTGFHYQITYGVTAESEAAGADQATTALKDELPGAGLLGVIVHSAKQGNAMTVTLTVATSKAIARDAAVELPGVEQIELLRGGAT